MRVDVAGFTASKVNNPIKKEKKDRIKIIFKFEYPKTFIANKSFEDLKCKKQYIEDRKTIKGSNSKIKVGT